MTLELPLQCRCGHVRGVATEMAPHFGNYAICYCDDCQAFAHYLGRPDVLDANGGTPIFQMAPRRMRITDGISALRAVKPSEKGMTRYFTDCCKTPIGNTISPSFPFVGMILAFLGPIPGGRTREEVLGKPMGGMGKFALGTPPAGTHPKMAVGAMARVARLLAGWWLTGKGKPSPFLDPRTQAPLATPTVLTVSERDALRPAVVAASR